MGNAGGDRERDDRGSLGSVHRSRAREFGAALWVLAAVSVAVVGRYATVGRVQATLQESWLPLVQVLAVLVVFGVLVPLAASHSGDIARAVDPSETLDTTD